MKIIRSARRRTFALQIKPHEGLIVRVPLRATQEQVEKFINDHKDWIEKHLKAIDERQKELSSVDKLTIDEIRALADKALKVIPERVKYYAPFESVISCAATGQRASGHVSGSAFSVSFDTDLIFFISVRPSALQLIPGTWPQFLFYLELSKGEILQCNKK